MTTTTKIFVILVCLFAFIFTPMAISFAARVSATVKDVETERATAKVAAAREKAALAILEAREADWQRQFGDDQKRFQDAQLQNSQLQRDGDAIRSQRDQLARSREMLETQTGILTAEVAVKSKHNEELGDAREKALSSQRELATANSWLTDQLQRARAENDVLKQQLNQRSQEMVACRQENDDLRRASNLGKAGQPLTAGPSSNVQALTPPARGKITGKVKQVDGNRVSIDVGSASGVRTGSKMVVIRDGSYVGDIKITSATPSEAVGQVDLVGAGGQQIQSGDQVVDEASFTAG